MREYNISVPQTISKRPASDFFVSFSLNTKYEKTIDIRISESVFLMPHLANTEVNPAKTAERTAAVSHNTVIHAPPQIPVLQHSSESHKMLAIPAWRTKRAWELIAGARVCLRTVSHLRYSSESTRYPTAFYHL